MKIFFKAKIRSSLNQLKYLPWIKLKMLILFPHPTSLSVWAGWRCAGGDGCLHMYSVGPSNSGLLHPGYVPGSQSPLFLALGHVSPQSCSFIPAAGTDPLTHTCTGTHTQSTPTGPPSWNWAWPHSSCRSCSGLPLSPSFHLNPRDTQRHTPMSTHPRESLTQEKS